MARLKTFTRVVVVPTAYTIEYRAEQELTPEELAKQAQEKIKHKGPNPAFKVLASWPPEAKEDAA